MIIMGSPNNRLSLITVILLFGCILFLRAQSMQSHVISWDVFGYYIYLPATFIHGDIMLDDISWIRSEMDSKMISTTLYQLTDSPKDGMMFFFFMGMALLYLPFFLIAHGIALLFGFPADGFSEPYQLCLTWGFTIYTLIGLIYARKILLRFFSDKWVSFLLIIILLGTNLYHFTAVTNIETANPLFMLFAMVVWYSIRWHETDNAKYLYIIAAISALITLMKPSEILCVLIPVLWGISSPQQLPERIRYLWQRRIQILKGIGIALLVFSPQMIYWTMETGYPIYDSYKNPGVGLDFFSPHTLDAFFSFKKGWLLYTPVMWMALFGFTHLYKQKRKLFWPILTYFILTTWVITSWTEWWYGGSYSIRPMTTSYVLLAIPMGLLLSTWYNSSWWKRILSIALPLVLVALNLFQMWQFRNYVLHPYTMTKDYYFAVFGKTDVGPEERELMAWERPFDQNPKFTDKENYQCYELPGYDTQPGEIRNEFVLDPAVVSHEKSELGEDKLWGHSYKVPYHDITTADHAWLRVSTAVFLPKDFNGETIFMTVSFQRKGGEYGYSAIRLEDGLTGQWNRIETEYLTPSIRDTADELKIYLWTTAASTFYFDDVRVEVCEPK